MIQPEQPFSFDSSTLRDPQYRERFEKLLDRAKAIRETGAYVDLATRHELLQEIEIIYLGNLKLYTTHYLQNKEGAKIFRHQLASQKHSIQAYDYQRLLESLEQIEALLAHSSYSENEKAKDEIAKATSQLEVALSDFANREGLLAAHRMELKKAMESVWAEDYAPLKTRYQLLKGGDQQEAGPLQIDNTLVQALAEKRSQNVTAALEKHKGNKAQRLIREFEEGYAYKKDFDLLFDRLKKRKNQRRIIFITTTLLVLGVIAFAAIKVPPMLQTQKAAKAFERTKNIDSWDAYDDFIAQYPDDPLSLKAEELQSLLDFGSIGELALPSGDTIRYEGQLDARIPDGVGKAQFINGQVYDGLWRAGSMEGQGTLSYPDGGEFVGTFDNGERIKGIQRTANGAEFNGSWKDGKLNDDGSARWPDGSRYVGEWRAGKFYNYGTFKAGKSARDHVFRTDWQAGASYTGNWRNNHREGQGTFTSSDGTVCIGQWKNDLLHGKPGTLKWPDGSSFRGVWENGRINGPGTYVDRFGNDFKGNWKGTPENITRKLPGGGVEYGTFEGGKYLR